VPRKAVAILAASLIAIGAVVWWICASAAQTDARMQSGVQRPSADHATQLEQAAEAADKAGAQLPQGTP
jgi:hypothetical protein